MRESQFLERVFLFGSFYLVVVSAREGYEGWFIFQAPPTVPTVVASPNGARRALNTNNSKLAPVWYGVRFSTPVQSYLKFQFEVSVGFPPRLDLNPT